MPLIGNWRVGHQLRYVYQSNGYVPLARNDADGNWLGEEDPIAHSVPGLGGWKNINSRQRRMVGRAFQGSIRSSRCDGACPKRIFLMVSSMEKVTAILIIMLRG